MTDRISRLIIVGVPGVGKSSVALELGRRTGLSVIETDDFMQAQTGSDVAHLLISWGEEKFRALEAQVTRQVLAHPRGIIVLGSGTIEHAPTRELLHEQTDTPIIWLRASLAAISPRLGLNRPYFVPLGLPRATLKKMEQHRESLYAEVSTVCVDTSEASIELVCEEILRGITA